MSSQPASLWLAVHCLHWPLRALLTAPKPTTPLANIDSSEQPLAVADQLRICAFNEAAAAQGVTLGMPSAVASALLNTPLLTRDLNCEAALLQQLCEACYAVTPYVIPANQLIEKGANGVALEVSRCLSLFNGPKGIAQEVRKHLQTLEIEAHWAWAHTAEGAWLLSYTSNRPTHQPPAGGEQAQEALRQLYALPIADITALGEDRNRLQAMGFNRLGELCSSTNEWRAIKKRLSASSIDYLEAVIGSEAQASLFKARPAYYQQALSFCEGLDAEYPISSLEWLQTLTEALLQRLAEFLMRHQCQVQHLQWRLYNIQHDYQILDVHLERIFSDTVLAADITRIHLEQRGLPFEVDRLELHCPTLQALQINSQPLWAEPKQHNRESLARLAAKLQSRMGDASFFKVSCKDGILPEACTEKISVLQQANSQLPGEITYKHRPLWLVEPPAAVNIKGGQLYWQGLLEIISQAERLQTQWWQKACARDYYIARRDDHQLLWLYQDLHQQRWYIHGVFG
ncbi:MAG TPA: DNA polymerase Y family protein [Marinagarivorans sp.]